MRRDYDYLEPPEETEEGEPERREDAYWNEVDRAYDEYRDRQLEERDQVLDDWDRFGEMANE